MESFVKTWSASPFARGRSTFILGMLADKDYGAMLRILAPHVREALALRPDSPRALEAEDLAEGLRALGCAEVSTARTTGEALEAWLRGETEVGVVCGSFYLVGSALRALRKLS
jgi:dihydrofolate synthase/folylpolyglutamate synthase